MPGPKDNANALRTGRKTTRHGMVLTNLRGRYPSPACYAAQLRRALESQVVARHGELSLSDVAEVNLATRYELTARIAELLVAQGKSENPVTDMKTSCWATAMRNRCIAKLGLDGQLVNSDPWAAFDAERAQQARSHMSYSPFV